MMEEDKRLMAGAEPNIFLFPFDPALLHCMLCTTTHSTYHELPAVKTSLFDKSPPRLPPFPSNAVSLSHGKFQTAFAFKMHSPFRSPPCSLSIGSGYERANSRKKFPGEKKFPKLFAKALSKRRASSLMLLCS